LKKVFWNKKCFQTYWIFNLMSLTTNFFKFITCYYFTKYVCICFFPPNPRRSNSHPTQALFWCTLNSIEMNFGLVEKIILLHSHILKKLMMQ
jgi:hypothetical protein